MLPQVLAGLGTFSLLSTACLLWLERLQTFFFTVAIGSLLYEVWVISRRPPILRTWGVKTMLTVSLMFNTIVITGWVVLAIRYH